jgi:F-type H+-transporting ATPase subunit alpha
MAVWEMALTLFAVNNGFLEGVELKSMASFEKALRDYIRAEHSALVSRIEASNDLSKDDEAALRSACEQFKKTGAY